MTTVQRGRTNGWLAWSLFAVCLTLYAATLVMDVARGQPYAPMVMAFLVTPAVGALVASRQPRNAVGWLLLATGIGLGVAGAASEYAALGETEALPLDAEAAWLANLVFISTLISGAILVPLLFPDGRLLSPRWRPALFLTNFAMLFAMVGYAVKPGDLGLDGVHANNPFGVGGMEWVLNLGNGLLVGAVLTAGLSLVLRFRRSHGEERQQLKWFAFAVLLMVPALSVVGVAEVVGGSVFTVELAAYVLLFFALPASIGIAVLRYRLWDIDLVIRRSLVYGTLWTAIAAAYFGIALVLGLAASQRVPVWLAIGLTVLVTLAFQPARRGLEVAADRWVFGRRVQPLKAVHSFGELLGNAESPGDIANQLARSAISAVPLAWVKVEVAGSAGIEIGRSREDPVMHIALVHSSEQLGEFHCLPLPGSSINDDEHATLSALCAQAGTAISHALLASRIVRAQEVERRRIERNIHDGAQQELVALVAKLGLARRQNGELDHAQFLTDLQDEVRGILANLRELAQGVHPSVLADGGLAAAVEDRCSRSPIPVELRVAPGLHRRFEEDIEGAAYFVVAEGLTNLLRHSGARSASVRLSQDGEYLTVGVSDDGTGFEPGRLPRGGGLLGLSDRLQAIGGSLYVNSVPGHGTELCASLPFRTATVE